MDKENLAFKASKSKSPEIIICTWDVETAGLNGELLCISYSHPDETAEGECGVFVGPDMIENFLALVDRFPFPCVWFAHNAQYDWRYLLEYMLDAYEDIEFLSRSKRDIFEIRLYDEKRTGDRNRDRHLRKYVFRDSYALYSASLGKFAKQYGSVQKSPFDHEAGFDVANEDHLFYAINDACALRSALDDFYRQWELQFDCRPSATKAGSAVRAWQKTLCDREYYPLPEASDTFCRKAYYGGLVFLTSNDVHENCISIDINSSYPYQMCEWGVPRGNPIWTDRYRADQPGFYYVTVKTPANLVIPILPRRTRDGIAWSSGTFETYVTNLELEFAAQNGYEILAIHEGYIFEGVEYPFQDFISICKEERRLYKGTSRDENAKLGQNSLYGRFGARQVRSRIILAELEEIPLGAEPTNLPGIYVIEEEAEIMALPHWAAWITACARLHLLRTAYALGVENCLYGDTDSITVREGTDLSSISIGNEYGQWKIDKVWRSFRARAPKNYAGQLVGKSGDIWTGRAKGLPQRLFDPERGGNTDLYRALAEGAQFSISYETTPSFWSIIKGICQAGTGTKRAHRATSRIEKSNSWTECDGLIRPRRVG